MNAQTKRTAKILAARILEKKATVDRCIFADNDVGAQVAFTALKRYRRALYRIALNS